MRSMHLHTVAAVAAATALVSFGADAAAAEPAASAGASAAAQAAPAAPAAQDTPAEAPRAEERAEKASLSIAAAPVLPVGDLSKAFSAGLGATLGIDVALTPKVFLVGRTGYIHHFPASGIDASLAAIPIWGGARYGFSGIEGGYLEGTLGPTLLVASARVGAVGRVSDSEVRVGMALGGGYRIGKLDLGGRAVFYDVGEAGDSMGLMAHVGWSFASF